MIRVENLGFTYRGTDKPTLDALNFEIADGEVYGLLGPSGAGKSTTQKILMGLLQDYTGSVEILGKPLKALGRNLYANIGVSFELPALYLRLTARENLEFFAALYDGPVKSPDELLSLVDLSDAADQRVDTFSKGMKMRLNLCRALLNDPKLLFLDEPTTGQDPSRARLTRDLIRRLKAEGKTIFLTTHNMAEADEVCDRVGFLVGGNIPVTGSPAALKEQYGTAMLNVGIAKEGAAREVVTFPMDGIGTNAQFMSLLQSGVITSLQTQEASLDDVFIAATKGRQ